MDKNWFIQRYSDIHRDLNILEHEIEDHLLNKEKLIDDNDKLNDLKKRSINLIRLLNKTRDDERRIFNY
jgi:hypothetical protein